MLRQDDFLSPEEVGVLNALCDANGCVPGEPEVFELPTDSQGNELERQEFINFVRLRLLRAQLHAPCLLLLRVDPRLFL